MDISIYIIILLIIAYIFDLTARFTKIPSVILILLLGWLTNQLLQYLDVRIPDFSYLLKPIGSIGLVLIILEAALELEFNKNKLYLVRQSFFGTLIPIFVISSILASLFLYLGYNSLIDNILNIIPLTIISSAIAIPSVSSFSPRRKELIIYESSFSDIIGVLLFNFFVFNAFINLHSFVIFFWQIIQMALISVISTFLLSFLLSKINHHIKFIPIILNALLIYELANLLHLPALIFILIFGLFLGNIEEMKNIRFAKIFQTETLSKEIGSFKSLTSEITFLVRSLFFLLFGFTIKTDELLNLQTLPVALGILIVIFVVRFIQLKISKIKITPLLFIAPRGLITIMLFLSIPETRKISIINNSIIIQIIVISSLVMMFGIIFSKKDQLSETNDDSQKMDFDESSEKIN